MWWRLTRKQFNNQKGEENKNALKKIVASGEIPGILAYDKGEPVGWCSVAPRENYVSLERSRTLRRVDDKPVWSVVCFYTAKPYRNKGMTSKLLRASLDYVKAKGGKILEGYPVDPRKGRLPDPFVYTGLLQSFIKVGFTEVFRGSTTRAIVRYAISNPWKDRFPLSSFSLK
jgi:GNAT superfamily N-acetyltransferase